MLGSIINLFSRKCIITGKKSYIFKYSISYLYVYWCVDTYVMNWIIDFLYNILNLPRETRKKECINPPTTARVSMYTSYSFVNYLQE